VTHTIRQLKALLSIYIQDGLAYRASGIIWVLNDALTSAVMPMVLLAARGGQGVAGYSPGAIVLYYIVALFCTSIITCHFMWEMSQEIKEGTFTTFLLRPVGFLQFMFVRNLAWRIVRTVLFIPVLFIIIFMYSYWLRDPMIFITWEAILSLILGHLVSFMFVMFMATLAFYIEEASSVFELYYIPMLFLSGQMFPIALFPEWARTVAHLLPFYYTTGLPTEILLGKVGSDQIWRLIGGQVFWVIFSYIGFKLSFKRGLKHYTGVGM